VKLLSICTLYARVGRRRRVAESVKGNHMKRLKRVLLLACLIVSLVQLDWERDRIYLLFAIASLLLVFYSELMPRPQAQRVPIKTAFTTGDGVSAEAYVAASPDTDNQAEVCSGRTQADHPERSRMLDCA
jgi:hypothetical protein